MPNLKDDLIDLFCEVSDLECVSKEEAKKAREKSQFKSYNEGYASGCENMCNEFSDKLARIIRKTTTVPEGPESRAILRRQLCRH